MKQQKLMLREVWKRAATGQAVTIPCESEGKAKQLRLALYNSVKSLRAHPEEDLDTAKAVEACSISFTEDRKGVVVQQAALTPIMQQLATILNVDPSGLESAQDKELRESGERMLKELGGASAPAAAPFPYPRRGDGDAN